mmetsp:Transcript_52593/g.151659  ORF Transcript_52593/g.151659 Transcript_52593/m.151659 type:complete len:284 (-) Transcript_52593:420-1271(-)
MAPSRPIVGSKVLQSKGDSDVPCPDVDLGNGGKASPRQAADTGDSPGSTSASSSVSMSNGVPYAGDDVLAHSYPVPVVVRNTFIDVGVPRSPSFDHFIKERQTVSCPGSGLEPGARPETGAPSMAQVAQAAVTGWPATMSGAELEQITGVGPAPEASTPIVGVAPQPQVALLVVPTSMLVAAPWAASSPAEASPVGPMTPSAVAAEGELSRVPPEKMASAGSALHGTGRCKPCAFVHTKGCESGENCVFCHMCDKGEKKRRQQAKREQRNERRVTGSHSGWGW